MSAVDGNPARNELGKAICESLGLDRRRVTGINIYLHVGCAALVDVEYFPDDKNLAQIVPVLKKYKIVPVEE